MKLIPLTQGKFAMVDDEDFDFLNQWKWRVMCVRRVDYAYRRPRNGKLPRVLILMHRLIMKAEKDEVVDHVKHNGLDNQKLNLRKCTVKQNLQNRASVVGSSSKYLGVCWHKRNKKWQASINGGGKSSLYIGQFSSETDAALAYNKEALLRYGEFANLNIIKDENNDINASSS